jgi:hypothetical protein
VCEKQKGIATFASYCGCTQALGLLVVLELVDRWSALAVAERQRCRLSDAIW